MDTQITMVALPVPAPANQPQKFVKPKKINSPFVLVDEQKRSILGEGRVYGMGFAFAKRADNILKTIMPISPCKDYLNDVVWSESTGKTCYAHGLHTQRLNIFEHGEGYLIFGICKRTYNENHYNNYERDYNSLHSNYKALQKFINWFEDKFKIKDKTKITQLADNRFLAKMPLFWSEGTYLISLYSLLLRTGAFYKSGEPMKFLTDFNYDDSDKYILNATIDKIEKMINGKIPKQNMNQLGYPHNTGIQQYPFN